MNEIILNFIEEIVEKDSLYYIFQVPITTKTDDLFKLIGQKLNNRTIISIDTSIENPSTIKVGVK